jgi:drug/metabolite transporter (DMT)-like permease
MILKPNYLYFLLPCTFVFICIIITINYIAQKRIFKVAKTVLFTFLNSIIFLLLIPYIFVEYLHFPYLIDSYFGLLYLYFISTVISVYIIKKQESIVKNL